jgi:hypothetical protein
MLDYIGGLHWQIFVPGALFALAALFMWYRRLHMFSKKPRTSPDDVFVLNLTTSAETRMRNAESHQGGEDNDVY